MASSFDSWPTTVLLAVVLLFMALFYFLQSVCNYWKDRNVPSLKPTSAFSIIYNILSGKKAYAEMVRELYREFEGERYFGVLQMTKPALYIRDPKLIERILVKDFSYFVDRGLPSDPKNEPLTANLVYLQGNDWRNLRQKLTPTFSSGKLKGMFQQMAKCGDNIFQLVEKYGKTGEEVELRSLAAFFTIDIIASTAFGLQLAHDSLEGKKFREMVNKLSGGPSIIFRFLMGVLFPKLKKLIGVRSIPPDVEDYFVSIVRATMEHRFKNNIKREDFFQLLLTLKHQDETGEKSEVTDDGIEQDDVQLQYGDKQASVDNNFRFTDDSLTAQSFVFLRAGSETASTTISVTLHYVAEYPEVQRRLQEEVDSTLAKHQGQWTYQAFREMTYLDQVLQESQRMFLIGHIHVRVCTTSYKVPESDLVIEKGTDVFIPTIGIHMDPAYYPDPEVFNPDRFEGNNFKSSALYLPFGDGPRMCIAMRFAVLEMKVFIARIVSKYSIKSSPRTLTPLRYDPRAYTNRALGGVWATFHPRS